MSIYGIFALHGLIDILTSIGTPLPPKIEYISAAISFGWYGLAFQYHANMVSKQSGKPIIIQLSVHKSHSIMQSLKR